MTPDRIEAVVAGWPTQQRQRPRPVQRPQATPAEAVRRRTLEMASRHPLPDDVPVWTRSPSGLVLRHADRWAAYSHVATRPAAQRQHFTFHDHNPARQSPR